MRRFTTLFLALLLAMTPLFALAEEVDTEARTALMDFVQEALDRGGYELYERDDETSCYSLGFGSTDDRLGNFYAGLYVYERSLLITAQYEHALPADRVDEAIRFVNLVNAQLLGSKFFIDPDTGEVFYEVYLQLNLLGDHEPDETVQDTLLDEIYDLAQIGRAHV